ncbi:hypothetical protein [Sphingomonas oryzagri]|uniref:Secreted protein n=1 Tax=Sphingomonas oryzagri TaxID=3042314 RepID=A0ABT6N3I3_9SPHN|nr:hypothetical protein [Sphingomonas oryzagri]MDH7638931.1 hypothetical protein [Sphingomonas oryzagri]
MITAILLAQLATSTTTCIPQPGITTCSTQYQQPAASAPVPDYAGMLGLRNQPASSHDDGGAANRRAAAYNQVGDLIARGDCDGAKRLAHFYNKPDIIRDTERACP